MDRMLTQRLLSAAGTAAVIGAALVFNALRYPKVSEQLWEASVGVYGRARADSDRSVPNTKALSSQQSDAGLVDHRPSTDPSLSWNQPAQGQVIFPSMASDRLQPPSTKADSSSSGSPSTQPSAPVSSDLGGRAKAVADGRTIPPAVWPAWQPSATAVDANAQATVDPPRLPASGVAFDQSPTDDASRGNLSAPSAATSERTSASKEGRDPALAGRPDNPRAPTAFPPAGSRSPILPWSPTPAGGSSATDSETLVPVQMPRTFPRPGNTLETKPPAAPAATTSPRALPQPTGIAGADALRSETVGLPQRVDPRSWEERTPEQQAKPAIEGTRPTADDLSPQSKGETPKASVPTGSAAKSSGAAFTPNWTPPPPLPARQPEALIPIASAVPAATQGESTSPSASWQRLPPVDDSIASGDRPGAVEHLPRFPTTRTP